MYSIFPDLTILKSASKIGDEVIESGDVAEVSDLSQLFGLTERQRISHVVDWLEVLIVFIICLSLLF